MSESMSKRFSPKKWTENHARRTFRFYSFWRRELNNWSSISVEGIDTVDWVSRKSNASIVTAFWQNSRTFTEAWHRLTIPSCAITLLSVHRCGSSQLSKNRTKLSVAHQRKVTSEMSFILRHLISFGLVLVINLCCFYEPKLKTELSCLQSTTFPQVMPKHMAFPSNLICVRKPR